jgi:membrane associated rhomboid family serine protease
VKSIIELRGGASKKRKSRTGSLTKTVTGKTKVGANTNAANKTTKDFVLQKYREMKPLTRAYITAVAVITILGNLIGEERAQALLALDPMRLFFGMEVWRPLTAACFLGKPSLSWVFNSYYLIQYGSQLENAYGPAQFLVFAFTQLALLTIFSTLMGLPFITNSFSTAMLYVLSRTTPDTKTKWLILDVPMWTLPYGLMVADILQAQSGAAAVPHIIGFLSGHFYFFHRYIWPRTSGEDWLVAPDFLAKFVDPNVASKKGKESINKALKKRKHKGKRLGSL